jgi:hypothetical protein
MISWTDCLRNEGVLHTQRQEERNFLHTIKRMKSDWMCQILRRNCFPKHIEGNIEGRI